MHILSLSKCAIAVFAVLNTTTSVESKVQVLSWEAAYAKAKILIDKMSLKQKVNITAGLGWMGGRCVGNTSRTTNPDFPSLCLQDSPLGVRSSDNITVGFAGINVAASFDKQTIYERGRYMGREFYGEGTHVQLGRPAMNFMKNPEGGRCWESAGEDPFLTGVTSTETVRGIQDEGVMETTKHHLLNDQELNRGSASSDVDARTLHEIYIWLFARSVEAGATSVMCGYNRVNGTCVCEDDYLLNTILKEELEFKGFVQSDWGAASNVLLKNVNNALPISPKVKKIALVGSGAILLNDKLNPCNGCSRGTLAQGWGSGTADFPYLVNPLPGFQNALKKIQLQTSFDDWNLTAAVQAAKELTMLLFSLMLILVRSTLL